MRAAKCKTGAVAISLLLCATAYTQTNFSSPAGEYSLRGAPETASGFLLKKDGSFQFFFSYGALDRYGKGQWLALNDTIVFNSVQKPAQDFVLLSAKKGTATKINVRIKESNAALLPHFYCRIKGGGKEQESISDKDGFISFKPQPVDTIELFSEFCPEKISVFHNIAKGQRHFVFAPEPWLFETFFQNFKLAVIDNGLRGGHPLSDKTSYFYEKITNKN